MECGECKGQGGSGYYVGDNQQTAADWVEEMCPTCHGSGRVPRPCPPGALPLTNVTLTTMPTRFYMDSSTWLWIDDPAYSPWHSFEQIKNACEERWKGLRFHLLNR
jgi:hypothetical protein